MTVQFGGDAGWLQWHQENWEVREEGKEQRETENFKSSPCVDRVNLEMYLKASISLPVKWGLPYPRLRTARG